MKNAAAYKFLKKLKFMLKQNKMLAKYIKKFINTADNVVFYNYNCVIFNANDKIYWFFKFFSVDVERSIGIFNHIIDDTQQERLLI